MATRILESCVLQAPAARVWDLLRPVTFSYYDRVRLLVSCECFVL